YNLRVLSGVNAAPVSRIIEALDWCIENDIQIINMSFGTDKYSPALYTKINEVYQHGILIVSSAGNGEELQYPAKFSKVISVGAVDSEMKTAEKTVTDETLDFVAPGINVYSTSLLGGYCAVSGTSAAAAHITGCAAVLLGRDPSRSADFIKNLMIYSCKDLGEKENYGYGMPDLEFALKNYDEFAAEYKEDDESVPINPAPAEGLVEDDCCVVGQWSRDGHEGLADYFFGVPSFIYPESFPEFIKIASYTCDATFLSYKALHGIENYVVAAKLLYEIAVKYKTDESFNHINYRKDLKLLLDTGKKGYYHDIINAVSRIFDIFINGESVYDNINNKGNPYKSTDLSSTIVDVTNPDYSNESAGLYFNSIPEKKAVLVFGMCFHLLGDIYAHRAIVPTTAISNEHSTCHGEVGEGNNSNTYFVVNDFVNDCNKHVYSKEEIRNLAKIKYNTDKAIYETELKNTKGLHVIKIFFEYIVFLIGGTERIEKKLKAEKQAELDKGLLRYATNDICKTSFSFCKTGGDNLFCYGAIRRLAGLGVLQFKDIKFALNTNHTNYKNNKTYYEDQSPSDIFHFERYEVAKKVTAYYTGLFLGYTPNATFNEFDPYYLISEVYGENISKYAVKIDQYYNYLKAYDQNSDILKATFWSNKSHSL
ncbi:MAG: S8 family serine peptidase, partial [Clostridia bacterium]|nr:S8 family serine peptidase [Clostridia bacterium]